MELSSLQKEIISDKMYHITSSFNDDELKYAIESLEFIKKERIEQDKEIILKEMQEEIEDIIGEIQLETINKYADKYNIAWCFENPVKVEYVLFEEKE